MPTNDPTELGELCKTMLESEINSVGLLGCPMAVLQEKPSLILEFSACSKFLVDGTPKDSALRCKVVFDCPPEYPIGPPNLTITSMTNFPTFLEGAILDEYERLKKLHTGAQYIMPTMNSIMVMLNHVAMCRAKAAELFSPAKKKNKKSKKSKKSRQSQKRE